MSRSNPRIHSFEAFQARSYFSGLDGLRAISILLVLFAHLPAWMPGGPMLMLQKNGRYGVSLFFVISGFLISTLLLREQEQTAKIDFGKFYARRALRLLPLYYAALLLQIGLVFVLKAYTPENQALFREKLPAYLIYYSNWLPTASQGPFFCAWSLAVEEQFYIVFGVLFLLGSRRFVFGLTLTALAAKPLVYAVFGNVDMNSTLMRILFSYQEPILLGVLAAFILHHQRGYEFLARWLGARWMPVCAGSAMLAWILVHPMRTRSSWDAQFLYLLMTLTVTGLVMRPNSTLFDNRVLTHLRKISYGIYLLHMFAICAMKKIFTTPSPVLFFFINFIAVVALASLVYKYFEQPIIGFYKRRFSHAVRTAASSPLPMEVVAV